MAHGATKVFFGVCGEYGTELSFPSERIMREDVKMCLWVSIQTLGNVWECVFRLIWVEKGMDFDKEWWFGDGFHFSCSSRIDGEKKNEYDNWQVV